MSNHGTFITSIHCMDGRVQIPISDWLKNKYSIDFVDTITEPGPNKIVADNVDSVTIASIKKRVDISVNKHSSNLIAICGHHDCAGNPVEKNIQIDQIKKAIKNINNWNFNVPIIGLWVDENWKVTEVK